MTAPFEIFVVKRNVLGCVRVKITVANWLRLHFSKTIEVELSSKTREFIVIEVLRNYLRRMSVFLKRRNPEKTMMKQEDLGRPKVQYRGPRGR